MNTQSVTKGKLKFMDNGSKRIGLYMGKDLLEACDNATEKTNATSRSEFISNAIEFYIAWLNSKNVSKVLTPALESVKNFALTRSNATAENISLMMRSGFRKGKLCRELL